MQYRLRWNQFSQFALPLSFSLTSLGIASLGITLAEPTWGQETTKTQPIVATSVALQAKSSDFATTLAQATPPSVTAARESSLDALLGNAQPLKVGTNSIRPLVFLEPDQDAEPYGYSIDLWNTIADELNLTTEWVQYDSARALLNGLDQGEVDVAIAGLTITANREANGYDFSQPFYESGLQLMVRDSGRTQLQLWSRRLFNSQIASALVLVIVSSTVFGGLIWAVEHRHNENFSNNPMRGVGQGIWFAIVTLGTFGYGDVTPQKFPGRLLSAVWMGVSFFIVADFIASMTVVQLSELGTSLDQLEGQSVGVVEGTTAEHFLRSQPVQTSPYPSLEMAAEALAAEKIAGIVRDYPNLYHWVETNPGQFRLAGERLETEDYGIAMAEGRSPDLLEAINRELLSLKEQGYFDTLESKWFSQDD